MIASTTGAAHFCWAYGPDWRELADAVNEGVRRTANREPDAWLFWNAGFKAGMEGRLYSPKVGGFIDLNEAEDVSRACRAVYREALRISRMK